MKKFLSDKLLTKHFRRVDTYDGDTSFVIDHAGLQAFADDVQEVVDSRDLEQRLTDLKGEVTKIFRQYETVRRIDLEMDRHGFSNSLKVDFNDQ